uniref:Tetratricopeptide repeat domain 24 n=1 Tax=Denticeps clupeoides TaxID=299321 RepID=A0AAY4E0Q7_9TELE
MASDGLPPLEGHKRKKKSDNGSRSKGGNANKSKVLVDIEWFTSSGHSALQQGDSGEALHCFKKAFKAAAEIEEIRVQRACAFNLGAAYVEAGKPQKGLDFLKKAQPGERGERVADLQFNLGVAHEALEDQAQAAGHYLQAARLYRSQGDGCSEGDTCMKLARCSLRAKDWTQAAQNFQRAGESYRVAGRLDSAAMALKEAGSHMLQSGSFTADDIITVFTECLELSVNIKDQNTLCKLYTDLGLSFSQLKLFPEAAECYEQALPLACSKPRRLAVVLQNLGAVHNTLSQYEQALDFHREAAALHGSLGSRRAQGRCFSNLAFALSQLENLEEAGENYLHSLQAFKDTGRCVCVCVYVVPNMIFKFSLVTPGISSEGHSITDCVYSGKQQPSIQTLNLSFVLFFPSLPFFFIAIMCLKLIPVTISYRKTFSRCRGSVTSNLIYPTLGQWWPSG